MKCNPGLRWNASWPQYKSFFFAESLGGAESLLTYPLVQTNADIPPDMLARIGLNDRLLRLSIGLEDAADLVQDLAQALG